jgi:hypothetical protein
MYARSISQALSLNSHADFVPQTNGGYCVRSEESTANEEFPLTSPCFGYRRNVPLLAKERDVAERQGKVLDASLRSE